MRERPILFSAPMVCAILDISGHRQHLHERGRLTVVWE